MRLPLRVSPTYMLSPARFLIRVCCFAARLIALFVQGGHVGARACDPRPPAPPHLHFKVLLGLDDVVVHGRTHMRGVAVPSGRHPLKALIHSIRMAVVHAKYGPVRGVHGRLEGGVDKGLELGVGLVGQRQAPPVAAYHPVGRGHLPRWRRSCVEGGE